MTSSPTGELWGCHWRNVKEIQIFQRTGFKIRGFSRSEQYVIKMILFQMGRKLATSPDGAFPKQVAEKVEIYLFGSNIHASWGAKIVPAGLWEVQQEVGRGTRLVPLLHLNESFRFLSNWNSLLGAGIISLNSYMYTYVCIWICIWIMNMYEYEFFEDIVAKSDP